MKNFALATLLILCAAPVWAKGSKAPAPVTCSLKLPPLHPAQSPDPYIGRGNTLTEAWHQAIDVCKADLERLKPGACEAYARDPSRMICEDDRPEGLAATDLFDMSTAQL